MFGKSKLAAILCGLFVGLCAVGPNGTLAQALLRPSMQDASGSTQPPSLPGASQAPHEQTAPVPQTADGLSAQIAAAAEAYQKGDAIAGRRLLEQFRLPHAAEWFAQNFEPGQNETLAKRYDRLFEKFVKSTENTLEELARNKRRKLTTKVQPGMQEPPPAASNSLTKPSGIVPVKELIYVNAFFGINLTGKIQEAMTGTFSAVGWVDTFTYQEGAFRFLGHGAWPFWVWEDRSETKASGGAYVPQPFDITAETVDEVIPFAMDKVMAALKPAMESQNCNVKQATGNRIECKRPRVPSSSEQMGSGGESVTALLETQGEQTRVRISTGKGFYGRLGKQNWSVPIYEEMVKILQKT